MNTNNLKRFAKEARIKLLDQVGRKLEFVLTHDTAELRGKQKEAEQLKKKIAEQGKEQVIDMELGGVEDRNHQDGHQVVGDSECSQENL